jgi:site-specific recombinase XerD
MSKINSHGGRRVPLDVAVGEFERFLTAGQGVSVATRECYLRHVTMFLGRFAGAASAVDFSSWSRQDVRSYVTDLGLRYSPMSSKLIATAVRSFLRFAWVSGWTNCDLTTAVGVVVTHRSGRIPAALSAGELQRLMEVPDRRTHAGARDYAVLVMLSRLGLRAGEVAALRLDDFDWRAATLTPRVKGGRRLCLPVPDDVGRAVVAYLQRRPTGTGYREVFLRVRGVVAPMTGRAVTQVVARHAVGAGLGVVRAHRLRHSTARAVLAAGGSLLEVGELLGHGSPSVTMVYASLDLESLAGLARSWPVEVGHV